MGRWIGMSDRQAAKYGCITSSTGVRTMRMGSRARRLPMTGSCARNGEDGHVEGPTEVLQALERGIQQLVAARRAASWACGGVMDARTSCRRAAAAACGRGPGAAGWAEACAAVAARRSPNRRRCGIVCWWFASALVCTAVSEARQATPLFTLRRFQRCC